MAKTLKDYILNYERDYEYRLKLTSEITDKMMSIIEKTLQKWTLIKIQAPVRIILQRSPEGFEIGNTETFVVDFATRYPSHPFIIQQELKNVLRIPENTILVCQMKDGAIVDPTETQDIEEDPVDPKELYGDEYNTTMLKSLKELRDKQRKDKGQVWYVGDSVEVKPSNKIPSPFGEFNPNREIPEIK